jgi:Tfp pilus assembly protein PilX
MGINIMGSNGMKRARLHAKGFTLIASLLLLLLLSGIAIGLMMMVNTEGKVGGTDLQNNVAYHSAEGGVEKMISDLAATFQNAQAPTASQICALSSMQPTMVGVTWTQYTVTPGALGAACPTTLTANWGQISSGPNQGLWAQIIPVNMLATAMEPGGQEVSMIRTAQVALIPVFQFGVFSESDLSFFSGPDFDMAGPVHTNGDLYPFVGPGSDLVFHNQVSAYGNVIRTRLANGWDASNNYNGTVHIPTAANGCIPSPPPPANPTSYTNCQTMQPPTNPEASPYGNGSLQGAGGNPPASSYDAADWNTFSSSTTHNEIINGNFGNITPGLVGTGAKKLSMPFVNGSNYAYDIIRRPLTGDSSALTQSREFNMAQIHVLLSDDPAELSTGGSGDANNVRLANVTPAVAAATGTSATNTYGYPMPSTSLPASVGIPPAGNTYNLYFASASNAVPLPSSCTGTACPTADWPFAPAPWTAAMASATGSPYPLLVPTGAPIYATNPGPVAINLCPPANVTSGSTPAPPANCPWTGAYPYFAPPNAVGATVYNSTSSTNWNLIDGWLRVEYKDSTGNWHPVTNEWLQLGFARGLVPPTLNGSNTPAAGTNPVNPNAILLLQAPADRDGSGTMNSTGTAPVCTKTVSGVCTKWNPGAPPEVFAEGGQFLFGITPVAPTTQSLTMYNWYPINFYDVREGEPRDTDWSSTAGDNTCTTNGVMNAVEIDVGNLKRWLTGAIGTSGTHVDYLAQNGYVLYFSDRRGMLVNPNPPHSGSKSGDAGLEDVINASSTLGTPDGAKETPAANSPEDVNQNGVLDNFGAQNLGLGFYGTVASSTQNLNALITSTNPRPDPFGTAAYNKRIASCGGTARKNWVSGARHVLKLVDGALGNVPLRTDAGATLASPGGFTVASENPVYIQDNYNSSSTDTIWNATPTDVAGHAAAAVIADSVTFLSNNWDDRWSMLGQPGVAGDSSSPTDLSNRPATTTYYRVAISGGKNMTFPRPSYGAQDFGTDGGVHNFLRYLENWSNQTLNYKGSLVSLYYATYNTGIFKCCTAVYSPPTRNYSFDTDFSSPGGLPPGTPLFRDVNSLGYRQLFTARKAGE